MRKTILTTTILTTRMTCTMAFTTTAMELTTTTKMRKMVKATMRMRARTNMVFSSMDTISSSSRTD